MTAVCLSSFLNYEVGKEQGGQPTKLGDIELLTLV